jgi:two-component system phosphate regulon sensor histidine kinase PhoR
MFPLRGVSERPLNELPEISLKLLVGRPPMRRLPFATTLRAHPTGRVRMSFVCLRRRFVALSHLWPMSRTAAIRRRLEKAPPAVWTAAAAGVLALSFALSVSVVAAVLMIIAGAAGLLAFRAVRDSGHTIAASLDEEIELVGLAELTPLLEALPDPAVLVDEGGRIAGSNSAARRQMQFEMRGQFLSSILRQPDVLDAATAAVRQGETRSVEYETSNQIERHTRCYVSPVTWGSERAAMLVFHDETARVNTERMRADFLANASHELRTPLASLTLLIETIAGPARDSAAERDRFLGMMQTQADRMRRLIEDLLSLSRIELDEHIPPSDRADLGVVARETIDALAGVAQERGVQVVLNIPDDSVQVVGERFQLTQVVQNLVDNAVKYTPKGAVVSVEVAAGGDREDTIAGAGRRWPDAARIALLTPAPAANRSYAYVRVEDSGPGVARRFLPRLGERFFRVEREMGDERGGTGLGLAIVKHIVKRHRGGFLVESQPGRGSAFIVYVELAEQE